MNWFRPTIAGALTVAVLAGAATIDAFTAEPDLVAVVDAPAVRTAPIPVAGQPPPTSPSTPAPSPSTTSVVAEVVALTNAARAVAGVPALAVDAAVQRAAEAHAADQAARQLMTHTGSDGSDAGDRLRLAGYDWRTWGENVAAGQRSATDVTDGWLSSPGHRANMLNPAYAHVGVAVALDTEGRAYWAMVLAAG